MTIIVEDGTIVPGANSYATTADANAYFLSLGQTTTITDANMIDSASFIERKYGYSYKGQLVDDTAQSMLFPRTTFVDNNGRTVNSGTIPTCLINAQYQAALLSSQGVALNDNAQSDSQLSSFTKTVEGAVSKSESYFIPVDRSPTAYIKGYISPILEIMASFQSPAIRG